MNQGPSEFAREQSSGDLTPFIEPLLAGRTLDTGQSRDAFRAIMSGNATEAEMGAFLALLATRVPTGDELTGAATVMREHVDGLSSSVDPSTIVDTAGTGGAPKTFNVSTASAIVAAGAGARVAKHGNRSRTGRGSAEVLQEIGVNVDAGRDVQARCLEQVGVCFCFAIHHHPAARHAMPVRKALGVPTVFNLLGPLTNPAGAGRQVMGVYADRFVLPVAEALNQLGTIDSIVMHSEDGYDEFSINAPVHVARISNGSIEEYTLDPASLGIEPVDPADLCASDLQDAARIVRSVLDGSDRGPARDMTLLSTAAALVVSGISDDFESGISASADSIDSGRAMSTLQALIEVSGS